MEENSGFVLQGGFQAGEVRVLRAGQTSVSFAGLKLAKMGPIKSELNFANSRVLQSDFCLKFQIGMTVIHSSSFRLVSSCSQMPQEVRDTVRPPKKPSLKRSLTDTESCEELKAKLLRKDALLENIRNLNTSILNNSPSSMNGTSKPAKEPQEPEDKEKAEQQRELLKKEMKIREEFDSAVRAGNLVAAATLVQDLAQLQRSSKR